MRSEVAICDNTSQCCPLVVIALLLVVIAGTTTTVSSSSVTTGPPVESTTTMRSHHYANATHFEPRFSSGFRVKSRTKRSIVQLAGMIRCVSGCDPFSYKSYGCYCGFLGAGKPVDLIDRCCLEHDWCYTYAACPQVLVYFVAYEWSCITPGYAQCGIVPFGGIKEKCSFQLCQCDRQFAKCLSRMPCPIDKPICQSSPIIAIQNIIVG